MSMGYTIAVGTDGPLLAIIHAGMDDAIVTVPILAGDILRLATGPGQRQPTITALMCAGVLTGIGLTIRGRTNIWVMTAITIVAAALTDIGGCVKSVDCRAR